MENRQKQTALVTGAAGFIGSHLVDELLSLDFNVIGIDNFLTGNDQNIIKAKKNIKFQFIEANVINAPDIYLPKNVSLDYVFHFASPASPPQYQKFPVETYLVNSLSTHLLLTYLKEYSPSAKFIFASTSEVYGDPLEHPQVESYWGNVNPNGPRACYDESKRMGETISGVFYRDFGIDVRIVRIFNTYGPRLQSGDGRVIPNFIKQAFDQKPYTIYGNGQQTRSYCYISDLTNGILKFALAENLGGETLNLGNPEEYTVQQTAELIHDVVLGSSCQPTFEFYDLPINDPTRRRPNIDKAKVILDWRPKISLRLGIEKIITEDKSESYSD